MRRRGGEEQADTELNLVPIMNLFTVLIPFLLLSAAFIQVKVINASVPAIADGSDPEREQEAYDQRPVVVNLQVQSAGYAVSASGEDLSAEELRKLTARIGRKQREYDRDALQRYLVAVKQRYPKSDTIIIAPDPEIPYQRIIEVMDTSRELPGADGAKRYLFPKVVVTSLHR